MKSSFHKIHTIASPITYVGLDNLKVHLGIFEDNGEDAYLTSLLSSAVDLVSEYIGQDLGSTVRKEYYPSLLKKRFYELTRPNTSSLTVKYYNDQEVLTTLSPSLYVVDTTRSTDTVVWKSDAVLPADYSKLYENFVVIEYTSVVDSTQVSEPIKQAIYMYCTEMYNNRAHSSEKEMKVLPLSAERLLNAYRTVRV